MSRSWKLGTVGIIGLLSVMSAWATSDVVISQVYGGGGNSGALYKNDFIELFNRGTTPVTITGWSVQYGSAAGSTWSNTTSLTGVIQPGHYFLIQEAAGTGGTQNLPTPDATGTINMSGTAGKVALVNTTTQLTGACPSSPTIVDFVGYGSTANCSETSPAPAPPNAANSDQRKGNGCIDTDNNSQDFFAAPAVPRNSGWSMHDCSLPTGACCISGVCYAGLTQPECLGQSGTYIGDGSDCSTNPCVVATGACCRASVCTVETEPNCIALNGVYQGDNTTCASNPCVAPCMTIAEAKAGGVAHWVRLCNVIVTSTTDLVSSGTNKSFTVQDNSGGLTIYGLNADIDALLGQCIAGDSITLEGLMSQASCLYELIGPFNFVSNNGHPGVPAPAPVTAADFADGSSTGPALQSVLVTAHCVVFGDHGIFRGFSDSYLNNYYVTDPVGQFQVRISTNDLDLVNALIPTTPVDITGVFTQFKSSAPCNGGYQLLPRSLADFVPASSCGAALGACCQSGNCQLLTQAACATAGGVYLGDGAACVALCCPAPLQAGDVVYGLSTTTREQSVDIVRGGSKIGAYDLLYFLQSPRFDNRGGHPHAVNGNLLMLDFGGGQAHNGQPICSEPNRPDQAGKIYNLATNGTLAYEEIYDFRTGIDCSRISGLSISPDNRHLAMWGYDTATLYVLNYSAGSTPGTGHGAAVTGAASYVPTPQQTFKLSAGAAWLDNDTILVYALDDTGLTTLFTVDFTEPNNFTQEVRWTLGFSNVTSPYTFVAYNPSVSPYVFCMFSGLVSGATTNKLSAIDPTNWTLVKTVDLSTSMNTAREVAVGADNFLYMTQYHSGTASYIDILNAANPASWTDNSSTNWYSGSVFTAFNGLDIAFAAAPSACPGDANCDGHVDFGDINPFVEALSDFNAWQQHYPGCNPHNPDVNGDGHVDFGDINPFVAILSAGGTNCP